ncbi:glutaminyl-peptide cyclotransferase [Rhabdothermincola sediminis]|uniref:glutaminyl-peptide cyclotransferase n=1 Tax=Rhabdothermincola sediminis TaxID=2751370 RepID=UPI0027DA0EE2|nr:glutaminyl-peptide cyclotransferase [Rhabdothermincola sediminis]
MPSLRAAIRRPIILAAVVVGACALLAASCGSPSPSSSPGRSTAPDGPPEQLTVRVQQSYPHDPRAFTQGLELADGSSYFESTGLEGRSSLRRVQLESGEVLQRRDLDRSQFAEGLTRVGDRLVQLTWRDGVAHVYDAGTLAPVEDFDYEGEGWGLCYDGRRLVMSDGSGTLAIRDPDSFELLDRVRVTNDGKPVQKLNELECVDGTVYANVFQTDQILRIDLATGRVTGVIDASGLLTSEEAQQADVLNGIAFDRERGVFLLTGKLWPKVFEVTFEPAGS